MNSADRRSAALVLYTRFLAAATAVLIFVGALVTTTGSGLAVPDWPLSFGTLFPRMVGGVLYEHGHRMLASAVGLFTVILAVWVQVVPEGRPLRRLSWLAVIMVILQGLLGGLTVLLKLPTAVSVAHGTLAQIFFCLVTAIAVLATPSWRSAGPRLEGAEARGLRRFALVAFLGVFVQLLIGATMRHMGAGFVIPDFPLSFGALIPPYWGPHIAINFAHRVWAYVVLTLVVYLAGALLRRHRDEPRLAWPAWAAAALVTVQVLLGALTIWTQRGTVPTSLHVMNGALVLVSTLVMALWVFRLSPQAEPSAELEEPKRAPSGGIRPAGSPARLSDWIELTKPRLVLMAVLTTATGYQVGSGDHFSWWVLFHACLGTLLMGAGGGTLNMVMEVEPDSRMRRTANRPLPAGRLQLVPAAFFGAALSMAGVLYLAATVGVLAGALAVVALVSYVFIYTPMKQRSSLCTVVGAIPGAIPPVIGWVAATGRLDFGAGVLFGILFLWQLPHFWGIAWLYREDYERGGMVMLTSVDPQGRILANQIILYTLALLPVSLLPTVGGMAGTFYFVSALVLGLGFLAVGIRVARDRTRVRARELVLASVTYLPLLQLAMVVNSR